MTRVCGVGLKIEAKLLGGGTEAGQLGLVPTWPLSQLGLGSTRQGQLGLFMFLMVNRHSTYIPNKKFGRYDLEYAR